ncbi:Flp pilus assembly protein CpaB [Georgenia faecalis]|uniref:Flp pilus assembly protein CpaB n=1 Tax=Georgenia faecalis TaxID=2483799 RepID=A0ABV9D7K3_9MICO|nr:Flp pilus assembly protein CpaB [Georgenia faecalis]
MLSRPGQDRPPVPPSQRRWRRVRRRAWLSRHVLLAVALAAGAWVVVGELRPPAPPTEQALVLARDVPAGTTLTASDLTVRRVAPGQVPAGALRSAAGVEGTTLAVGLPAGFWLSRSVLVGPGLSDGAPPGTVVVPVRLADAAVAQLLRPGDRVDLLAATSDAAGSPGAAQVVAERALVLAQQAPAAAGGLLGTSEVSAPLVFVALAPERVTEVVGASAWAPLRVVLAGAP